MEINSFYCEKSQTESQRFLGGVEKKSQLFFSRFQDRNSFGTVTSSLIPVSCRCECRSDFHHAFPFLAETTAKLIRVHDPFNWHQRTSEESEPLLRMECHKRVVSERGGLANVPLTPETVEKAHLPHVILPLHVADVP